MAEPDTKFLTPELLHDIWRLRYGTKWAPLEDFEVQTGISAGERYGLVRSGLFDHHLLHETMQHMLRAKEK